MPVRCESKMRRSGDCVARHHAQSSSYVKTDFLKPRVRLFFSAYADVGKKVGLRHLQNFFSAVTHLLASLYFTLLSFSLLLPLVFLFWHQRLWSAALWFGLKTGELSNSNHSFYDAEGNG
ncbi:hypothetical protein, unlikely [Trypanosoma brucei gambiense DAL972]|uniref:Uncharacterized protein n=1 Tax=Trypanosoma brucei gambiense (strain MHOM/CI/86/DAL972) TaxID=679716 RepID=C9ZVZ2_TRYB9|nr:hypothetical protein, unlikely [Trypanosoma brucei gambiense DAL972]CBH13580.1 hypothetical protein, unlikely [Trypanosoma brucei gambiense DAL972]|eukprot:XP_011775857.1 hypothetical protein, unlikely [Trypanosoma brucei gambiense DAL972]